MVRVAQLLLLASVSLSERRAAVALVSPSGSIMGMGSLVQRLPAAPCRDSSSSGAAYAATARSTVSMMGVQRRTTKRTTAKDGNSIMGRTVARVQSRDVKIPNKLFFDNVEYDATHAELLAHFETVGPVLQLKMTIDWRTKEFKGFGFVMFEQPIAATSALFRLNGVPLRRGGRLLRLGEAIGKRETAKAKANEAAFADREAKRAAKAEERARAKAAGEELPLWAYEDPLKEENKRKRREKLVDIDVLEDLLRKRRGGGFRY